MQGKKAEEKWRKWVAARPSYLAGWLGNVASWPLPNFPNIYSSRKCVVMLDYAVWVGKS
jgi:hypothetical protein